MTHSPPNNEEQIPRYLNEIGIPEYWIVDPDSRAVRSARMGIADLVSDKELTWAPDGAGEVLTISVPSLFGRSS